MRENISIKGRSGTYYEIGFHILNGCWFFLLESEQLGEEDTIIVSKNNRFVMSTENGFHDLVEYIKVRGGLK